MVVQRLVNIALDGFGKYDMILTTPGTVTTQKKKFEDKSGPTGQKEANEWPLLGVESSGEEKVNVC